MKNGYEKTEMKIILYCAPAARFLFFIYRNRIISKKTEMKRENYFIWLLSNIIKTVYTF